MSEAHALHIERENIASTKSSLSGLKAQLVAHNIGTLIHDNDTFQISEQDDPSFAVSDESAIVLPLADFRKTLDELCINDKSDIDNDLFLSLKPQSEKIIKVRVAKRSKAVFHFPHDDPEYTDFD